MNIQSLIGKLIPFETKLNIQNKLGVPHMFWSILNMKKNGFNPKYIVDAGAFIGDWTINCRKIFPQSNILMIEGQESKKEILSKITNANTFLEINLIGSEDGKKVNFIHEG